MLAWLAEGPAFVAAVTVIFGPGVLIALAAGLRGLPALALAPAFGTAALTGAALVLGAFGIAWRPVTAILASLVIAAVVLAVRLILKLNPVSDRPASRSRTTILVVGVLIGGLYTLCRLAFYIGEPAAISQTNDAAFHLSALRFAIETGDASPLKLNAVIGASSFYPSGWHVLTTLVPQLTGVDATVAANLVSVVLGAAAWPLGIAYLTRVAAGTIAAAISASLSGFVAAFPLLLMQWGILYPQLHAVSLLPAGIALVLSTRMFLVHTDAALASRWFRVVALTSMAVAAIAAAQPSVILPWAAAALSIGFWSLISAWRGLPGRLRLLAVTAIVVAITTTIVLWLTFASSVSVTWPPSRSKLEALVDVLGNGHLGYPWAVGVSMLAFVGLAVAMRRPELRWLPTLWVVLSGLYFLAAAVGSPGLRSLGVGAWYTDPYRLAALAPVAVIPLAGIGGAAIARWAGAALARDDARGRRQRGQGRAGWSAVGVIAFVGAAALVVSPQIARRDVFAQRLDPNLFTITADSFLSEDELAILRRLDEHVPPDGVVVANPSTGASFGYAISGRDVVPRTWAPPSGSDYGVLWNSLRDVASDPSVCSALDAFKARYVLDFGPGEVYPGRWIMPGFTDIDGKPGFELLDREGDASLWRVTACG